MAGDKLSPAELEHSDSEKLDLRDSPKDILPRTINSSAEKLSPTPTDDPDDPLNWPMGIKIFILIQTSLLAALGGLNTATINPAYGQLSKQFGITTVVASYQTTVCIALNGIAPWIWIPFSHKFGRRPVYLFTTLLAFASALGAAYTQTYAQLIVARVFNGFFPVAFALGASTVTDLFFYHQRGRAMGFFTITMTTGSHIAPIVGGLIGQYLHWRWVFKFLAIVDGVLFVVILFFLPETMYNRPAEPYDPELFRTATSHHRPAFNKSIFLRRLRLYSLNPAVRLKPTEFVISTLRIVPFPSIIFPALYYATMYGFASILPAVTVTAIFIKFFHWSTLTIGLTYGGALTIGGILGECVSGWVLDLIIKRAQRRLPVGQQPAPEVRLKALWAGNILVPAGLLVYGFTLQYHANWFSSIFGIGLACFGLQIITTTTYTYSIDCYRPRSAEVAQVFNFIRQEIGFTFAFYVVDLGNDIGFQFVFLIFAILGGIVAFIGPLLVMWRGETWRQKPMFTLPEVRYELEDRMHAKIKTEKDEKTGSNGA